MKVLVFGRTGQVATHLAGYPETTCLGREAADLSDPAACAALIAETGADAIVNAAAYTAVDRAEEEPELARMVNAEAPGAMARAAAERGIPFLHVSTDYVFDGSGSDPRGTDAPTGPLNIYGRTKLEGEEAVRAAGGPHAILRTSWVFSAHGGNFVKTMLRLSETRDALRIVDDQIGGPTPADGIAETLMIMARAMADGQPGGTHHYAGAPGTSWADFAREIFAAAGRNVAVEGIPTSEYPTPAARPLNSRLDCAALTRDFGVPPADWKAALKGIVSELTA
ncbi:dTDP-4-dehydrorhamnose reductase [Palleronia sp. LCG004]|uniref:dTDP-4-dehydrorhamnose reductase n=1 Tax=Palleronia sp. LCG004 TaxID=3079304 RepID=UPI002943923F|nr:dTDP-4-dehydrorhamnose reductase [Palleronia sp. LCG004]WOI58384.1 dTDP-4-dehydrorhamnose reductase [Palleronia sp. LCG004]